MSDETPHHPDRVVVPFPDDVPQSTPIGNTTTIFINGLGKSRELLFT